LRILDLDDNKAIFDGATLEFTMKLRHDDFPVFNNIGAAVSVDANRASIPHGDITFTISSPNIKKNLCGWWWEIKSTFLGDVTGEKMWLVLHNGIAYCYEGPFEGRLVREIDVSQIVDMRKFDSTQISGDNDMDGVSIIMKDGTQYDWAWIEDQRQRKGLWKNAFGVYSPRISKSSASRR
jgi:hypothetical protein